MPYQSTKTYGHEVGLSCAFRQWRAESHCHFIHGYALSVMITFGAVKLDHRNWVVDFGGLKDLKSSLQDIFDHKTVIAADDPHVDFFRDAHRIGVMDVVVVEDVGCEAFAKLAFDAATKWIKTHEYSNRCHVVSVEIREHGANSAIFTG